MPCPHSVTRNISSLISASWHPLPQTLFQWGLALDIMPLKSMTSMIPSEVCFHSTPAPVVYHSNRNVYQTNSPEFEVGVKSIYTRKIRLIFKSVLLTGLGKHATTFSRHKESKRPLDREIWPNFRSKNWRNFDLVYLCKVPVWLHKYRFGGLKCHFWGFKSRLCRKRRENI